MALRRNKITDDEFDDLSDVVEDGIELELIGIGFSERLASAIAREVASKAEDQLRSSLRTRRLL